MRRGAEVGKGFKQENVRKAVSTETKGGKAKGRHRPLRFQPRGKYTQSVTATSGLTGGGEAGAGILGPCQPPCLRMELEGGPPPPPPHSYTTDEELTLSGMTVSPRSPLPVS